MAQLAALLKGVDDAAHAASTSFLNLLRAPTEGQARAGNYKKGRCTVAGLPLTIENAAGTRRKPEWAPLTAHYGYVRGTKGADGDQVDVFVRQGTPDDWTGPVFVVDQYRQDGSFDEHKCMVGWTDRSDAVRAYLGNYPRGWNLGPVAQLSSAEFRAWIKSGDTGAPLTAKVAKLLKAYDPAMDLTERLLAILIELGHLRKVDFSALLKGDVAGHPFYGNQWTEGAGGGEKPTKASAKGVKGGVHELLSSGHSFTFEELKAATGVTTDKHLSSALSELKNPKWAGPKGALTILKVGNHYYVQKPDPNAGQQKPAAAEKPVAAAKPAAAEKPTGGMKPQKAEPPPTGKMGKELADAFYATATNNAFDQLKKDAKDINLTPKQAAQNFKDAKAMAMAQWAANTTGKEVMSKEQQVFAADEKLVNAVLDGTSQKEAMAQWKADTAAEKAGVLGKPAAASVHQAKPEALAQHAAASAAAQSLSAASPSPNLGIPSAAEIEKGGVHVSAKDFDTKTGGGRFMKEVTALKSAMDDESNGPVGNKVGVQKRISDQLKDSKNFEAMATASNTTPAELVKKLVSTWAGSSGDSNALSVSVQLAVRDVFGMKSEDLEMKALKTLKDYSEDDAYRQAASMVGIQIKAGQSLDGIKAGLREFVGAQYKATQKWFADKGITHVSVFRGMKFQPPSQKPSLVDLKLQPASSFSTNLGTAKSFAGSGTVFFTRVPASQVLGSYLTGFGCSNEHEVVLLAGPKMKSVAVGTSKGFSSKAELGKLISSELVPPVGKSVFAALLKADATLSPDASLEDADWTKTTWDLPPLNSPEFEELGVDKEKFMRTPAYLLAEEQGLVHDGEWVADWVTATKPAGAVRLVPKEDQE